MADTSSASTQMAALGDRPPCGTCGGSTAVHTLALVIAGDWICANCATGRTELRRRGVPI